MPLLSVWVCDKYQKLEPLMLGSGACQIVLRILNVTTLKYGDVNFFTFI